MPFQELPEEKARTTEAIDQKKRLTIHVIRGLLDGHYCCTRVWEAWRFKTMHEDDFIPSGDTELPERIYNLIAEIEKRKIEEIRKKLNEGRGKSGYEFEDRLISAIDKYLFS